ncbi:monovalent cation:proton antiporter family protein [Fictibacillus nanhaiensis]|uniref:monovalent cation:proton antiporter family protein n=1 Tax=Fictibacillus nanhaiensis TaxID=742169 RepID=UPI001C9749C3|nr:monovalent cation:proton antiporter family protein [Fictibacillus nanhaiensis]MBY6036305.1 monovalent cation:proton antiporter family protein [Fictibacillus nanhaiensis]
MEEHASFTSLVLVILTAFLIPILLNKMRLRVIPVVVAEIIAGIILGKSGFDIVHPDAWLEILSVLGFIFLMFLSGLEIDFSIFAGGANNKKSKDKKKEPNRIFVASVIFLFIIILSYLLSLLFVWGGFANSALFMTLIISTISLGVVVPTLKEEKLSRTTIGQIILLVAVIADLVTMILLALFVSFESGDSNRMWLLLILFAAGIILYFVGKQLRHQSFIDTMSKGTVQLDTRAVFTLIIVLVGLSETVGAENILGAFLAGVLVSLLSPNKQLVHKLDSFGYGFLIPIFFVMVGVELDIRSILADPKALALIPLLLLGLLISKFLPILFLKKWYDWKTVTAAGFLLTSTLSLVIAAAKIGERIEIIDARTSSALILTAVISSIITPIFFKKFFPKQKAEEGGKEQLVIVGANQFTLPLTSQLDKTRFEQRVYHTKQDEKDQKQLDSFNIQEIKNYDLITLKAAKVFATDVIICATGNDKTNEDLALFAKEEKVGRIIARIEDPKKRDSLKEQGIEVYSVYFSSQVLLKALIENPSVVDILTGQENSLNEILVTNSSYNRTALRNFPFLGDSIIVRIYRGTESIVPHGDTEILLGDKLVVTGSKQQIKQMKDMLS